MEIEVFKDKQTVAEKFSKFLSKRIQDAKEFHVALSGGSTPKVVFDHLAEEYEDKIDWSKLHLYWGDERCVAPDDEESNYNMTKQHLLSKIDFPEANIHRIKGENDPEEEARRYSKLLDEKLPNMEGVPQFDMVLLGMGSDGHTASIFPKDIKLWDDDRNCVVATHPETGQKRVSITGKLINNAKTVAFLVTGESKSSKVEDIISQKNDYKSYPASKVKPKSDDLYWFMDRKAAGDVG